MRAAVFAAVAVCGLATEARADVVTLNTPVLTRAGDTDTIINLQPFDTTLGTLTGASVEISATFNLGVYRLLVDTPNEPVTSVTLTPHLSAFPLQSSPFTFPAEGPLQVNGSSVTGRSFAIDVTGAIPLFYATDPLLNLLPFTIVTNNAGGVLDVDTGDFDPSFLNGIARVSYTYDAAATASPVPEPASIAMLGLGIAAFGAVRRQVRLDRAA